MRAKTCFNCSNDYACIDCVCFDKWQSRDNSFEVKSFSIDLEAAENKLAAGFKPIIDMLDNAFTKGG